MEHPRSTPDDTARSLASVVLEALAEAGISQREAAEKTGIPSTTLNRRLSPTGNSPLTADEIVRLATLLGTRPSALMAVAEQVVA
ncbi:helix-turn-helix transcriptional regulator [Luteipulveratus mongoliensis]|uniref:HTH cro/C1-type domain-containing protein n=1 Tax=Luteipulveratus mongoliensis TaxID=571913 RepID=A0A0K1JGG2_9MICO|nr:helix-turn-helix transcriptional regulator [Luteipulveratus mongoliensis]AKU15786.1 hypothetical protein VV02_07825 [Luteipulveratus mongoliensis]